MEYRTCDRCLGEKRYRYLCRGEHCGRRHLHALPNYHYTVCPTCWGTGRILVEIPQEILYMVDEKDDDGI